MRDTNNHNDVSSSLSSFDLPLVSSTPQGLPKHHIVPPTSPRPSPPPLQTSLAPFPSPNMGQNQSTVAFAPSTGQRIKRVLTGRRQKQDDAAVRQATDNNDQARSPSSPLPQTSPVTPRQFSLFGHRKPSLSSSATTPSSTPPSTVALRHRSKSQLPVEDNLRPVVFNSSGISASVQVIRQEEDGNNKADEGFASKLEPESKIKGSDLMKEDWRKSDSTMASSNTIRPGTGTPMNPRPVSIAESVQSSNTIVPTSKRLSMLMTDTELSIPQEIDASLNNDDIETDSQRSHAPSLETHHQRSLSVKLGSPWSFKLKPSEHPTPISPDSQTALRFQESLSVPHKPSTSRFKTAAGNDINHNPNTLINPPQHTDKQGSPLAVLSATSSPPSSYQNKSTGNLRNTPNLRQAAVSISGSIAPAAMELGKRAMERMGRAWGSRGAGSSSASLSSRSEQSSSTSSSSSVKRRGADYSGLKHPNDSVPSQISSFSMSTKGKRRTPNAPSGSWSIASSSTSSTSVSDVDYCPALSAINSGKCLRGSISPSGGLVFGRNLADCVKDTAIDTVRLKLQSGEYSVETVEDYLSEDGQPIRTLEQRFLPAVVVRCVQHLLIWGVQEEGLFRMNGRSSHIKELRAEFDKGADYDISECAPYDIDPHVLSSLFKLYLRELPEPLLTFELMPLFDAIMAAEDKETNSQTPVYAPVAIQSARPQALAMRKPPSLTTLAMPNLAGMRPASRSLLHAIAMLISRLPKENRDLLFTVTELVKATASRSKATKMPLANLLLVFCPTLNMKPSLLRILCESDGIWHRPPDAEGSLIAVISNPDDRPSITREISLDSIAEVDHEAGVRRNWRGGHVATLYKEFMSSSSLGDATHTSLDSISYKDDSSELSLPHSGNIVRDLSPPLSSSVESLATPSSSDVQSVDFSRDKEDSSKPLVIADIAQLTLDDPIFMSVPFPISAGNLSSPSHSSRKSFANISLPSLDSGSLTSRLKRVSRTSLRLFSKPSASSLRSFSSSISSPLPTSNGSSFGHPADEVSQPIPGIPPNSETPPNVLSSASSLRNLSLKIAPVLIPLQSTSSRSTDSPASALYETPPGSSCPSPQTAQPDGAQAAAAGGLSHITIENLDLDGNWSQSILKAVDIHDEQLPADV